MTTDGDIQKLHARISYLEDNRRYIQNALETVLSLGEFQTVAGKSHDTDFLLEQAGKKTFSIIPFSSWAFYLVDEETYLFNLALCAPVRDRDIIEQEVDRMIDQGLFAWAVREKRGVFIPANQDTGQFLLHVIASNNRIRGMFVGKLPETKQSIADTSLTLLSVILMRVSNALEENEFRKFMENQKIILEQQVEERTRALTHSESQLKQAMEKANELAMEAKKASEAKSDFLAKMSHELRTPLNGIIGLTEVALSTHLDANQLQILNIIDRESSSLLKIINNILDFSKVEAGKLSLESSPFDLRRIVDEVADTLALKASQKGLELTTFLAPDMPTLFVGDAFRIKQILLNLTSNALKFTDKGEISIKGYLIQETPDTIEFNLTVNDTGIGIPKEKHQAIFQGFIQADDSTTRKYGGTGLGTTISKQLVELMGGSLSFTSSEGRGSSFSFSITLQKQSPAMPRFDIGGDPATIHAFIVDFPVKQGKILSDYMMAMGCRVTIADNSQHVLNQLEKHSGTAPHEFIAFIDLHQSASQGGELGRRIKQIPSCPVRAVIGLTDVADLAAHVKTDPPSVDGYLTRPVKLNELCLVIKSSFDGANHAASPALSSPSTRASHDTAVNKDQSHRILLVDDYPTNQKVADMHLSNAGYTVDIAEDGAKAVEAFKNSRYHLILMDIQMPVMDGYTATSEIRKLESAMPKTGACRTPIVAMSAHAFKEDEQKCLDAGMDDFISKPIRREHLLEVVNKWVSADEQRPPIDRQALSGEIPMDHDTPPMDLPTAVDEFGDKEVLMQVVEQLLGNVEKQIEIMTKALETENFTRLQRESHAIKGGAGTIEAHTLSALAAQLELTSRENNRTAIGPLLNDFRCEFDRLKIFVEKNR